MITGGETEPSIDALAAPGPTGLPSSLARVLRSCWVTSRPAGQRPSGAGVCSGCLNSRGSSGRGASPLSLAATFQTFCPGEDEAGPERGNPEPLDRGRQGERSAGEQDCRPLRIPQHRSPAHWPDLRPPEAQGPGTGVVVAQGGKKD